MQVLLDGDGVERSLRRMAAEIAERTRGSDELMLVGIRRGGIPLARALAAELREAASLEVPLGSVDITFYRDDAATRLPNPRIGPTEIPGSLDGRHVILVDDVLFTGRTVRAALDALLDYGRPRRVELLVLIERSGRELPIRADYVGKSVDLNSTERVDVIEIDGRPSAVIMPSNSPTLPPRGMP
jgi:pyrimidine operon attenuation protein/uracil phosphoribosyltransferase